MLKRFFLIRKHKTTTRNMKIMKGKSLTGIGQHAVKVVDQSLKNLTRRFKDKNSKTTYVCNK